MMPAPQKDQKAVSSNFASVAEHFGRLGGLLVLALALRHAGIAYDVPPFTGEMIALGVLGVWVVAVVRWAVAGLSRLRQRTAGVQEPLDSVILAAVCFGGIAASYLVGPHVPVWSSALCLASVATLAVVSIRQGPRRGGLLVIGVAVAMGTLPFAGHRRGGVVAVASSVVLPASLLAIGCFWLGGAGITYGLVAVAVAATGALIAAGSDVLDRWRMWRSA